VTRAARVVVLLYGVAYFFAVWAGAGAVQDGNAVAAGALFAAAAGLLLGIRRECTHTAHLVRLVGAYRHHQLLDPADGLAAALEFATAQPPGCRCETWWTTLGDHHAPHCPAHPSHTHGHRGEDPA
jgi:hypothetical protein